MSIFQSLSTALSSIGLIVALASCDTSHSGTPNAELSSAELKTNLSGKMVNYEAPRTFDARVHEVFNEDGRWSGVRYSVGPFPFSGRWFVRENQLCTILESGQLGERFQHGAVCRRVRWGPRGSELLMEHIMDRNGMMVLDVRELR